MDMYVKNFYFEFMNAETLGNKTFDSTQILDVAIAGLLILAKNIWIMIKTSLGVHIDLKVSFFKTMVPYHENFRVITRLNFLVDF